MTHQIITNLIPRKAVREETRQKVREKNKYSKMADIKPDMLTVSLNTHGLKTAIKREKFSDWIKIKTKRSKYMIPLRILFRLKDTNQK